MHALLSVKTSFIILTFTQCERGKLSQNNAFSREATSSIFELCTKHTFLRMGEKRCSET